MSDRTSDGLSALIIAKDEENDLPGCLESLSGLADEIVVVVDADSRDRSEEIARGARAKVIVRRFDDYAGQRQAALDACGRDWVLWIDPDERVTPELKAAILRELANPRAAAYDLAFEVRFLGKALRWGGLGRETHRRLFLRRDSRFGGGAIHEGVELGPGRAAAPLPGGVIRHQPYQDLADYLQKLDRYTTLAARKKYEAGARFHWWHHLVMPWELFRRGVLRLGFLDGTPGLVWTGLSAFHSWLKYVKLHRLERRDNS